MRNQEQIGPRKYLFRAGVPPTRWRFKFLSLSRARTRALQVKYVHRVQPRVCVPARFMRHLFDDFIYRQDERDERDVLDYFQMRFKPSRPGSSQR